MSTFIAVFDACVLYPAPLRDLLLRLAEAGVVHAKWTDDILDETFRSITRGRADLDPTRLARTRRIIVTFNLKDFPVGRRRSRPRPVRHATRGRPDSVRHHGLALGAACALRTLAFVAVPAGTSHRRLLRTEGKRGFRVVSPLIPLKSRSALQSSRTPCWTHSAATRASWTLGPTTCPASMISRRARQCSKLSPRSVSLGLSSQAVTCPVAASSGEGGL